MGLLQHGAALCCLKRSRLTPVIPRCSCCDPVDRLASCSTMSLPQIAHSLSRDQSRFVMSMNASTQIKYSQLLQGKGEAFSLYPSTYCYFLFSHGSALSRVFLHFWARLKRLEKLASHSQIYRSEFPITSITKHNWRHKMYRNTVCTTLLLLTCSLGRSAAYEMILIRISFASFAH
jgi:hypothetical protein